MGVGTCQRRRLNLDQAGWISSIIDATLAIDFGRKGFATRGKEHAGRLSYENGISTALTIFKEVQISADLQTLILAEYTFICQELQFCEKSDKDTLNSLNNARQGFDDAFLILKIVEDKALYHVADKAIPHHKNYRIGDLPKDSFHIACASHKARIKNMLRTPGVDSIEKALLNQRHDNLTTAKNSYIEKQRKAMTA